MMREQGASGYAIFFLVFLLHGGVVAWFFMGPSGCQQSVASPASAAALPVSGDDPLREAISLNLALSDRVAVNLEPNQTVEDPPRGEVEAAVAAVVNPDDPESRLVLPEVEEARKRAEEAERQRQLALERERERQRKAREEAERHKAREAELARKRAEEAERQLAQEKEEERARKAAEEVARQRAREAELERKRAEEDERQRQLALAQEKEREGKAKEEADRQNALEAEQEQERERQRQLAIQRERERKIEEAERKRSEEAERKRRLALQREKERRELEAERRRQLTEAQRVEKARVVNESGARQAVTPEVVRPNVVGGDGDSESEGAASAAEGAAGASGGEGRAEGSGPVDMGVFRATVQKMIQSRWSVPRGIAVKNSPEVLVRINRAGRVTFTRNNRSSGIPDVDRSAINAVRMGSKLIPLPEGYQGDEYEFSVKFQID